MNLKISSFYLKRGKNDNSTDITSLKYTFYSKFLVLSAYNPMANIRKYCN